VAQQENAPNKPVHLMYLIGTVILFYLLQWTIDWVWGTFTPSTPSDFKISLAAAVGATLIGVITYRNDQIYGLANEVASELKKVTWPTAKETRQSTVTVIFMAILSALILFTFDLVWSGITERVYG
jgi:preprotein translocase subunit SecE